MTQLECTAAKGVGVDEFAGPRGVYCMPVTRYSTVWYIYE